MLFRSLQSLDKSVRYLSRRNFSKTISEQVRQQLTNYNNLNDKIYELLDRKLLFQENHPLSILENKITTYFSDNNIYKSEHDTKFKSDYFIVKDISPVTTIQQCFDTLLIPTEHQSRQKSDSYYINETTLLRPHTSAHQHDLIKSGNNSFLAYGDVYRRDEIDATHYPAFHQMEAVRIFNTDQLGQQQEDLLVNQVVMDLKSTLENLVRHLFGQDIQMRWIPAYFPFTEPSFELEIYFQGEWLEMLGCGVIEKEVMQLAGRDTKLEYGWAAGLGLERFAMRLFDIPDIRLFWSKDERFINQFKKGQIHKFQTFSKYPACYKDVTFWLNESFHENDLFEVVRNIAGDLIEKVECVDHFIDQKKNRTSKCFRIHYRSLERTLHNEEIDVLQFKIRNDLQDRLKLQLR